jgi:hypothetical protein
MPDEVKQELESCLRIILKPFVRILLKIGLGYKHFAQISKEVFVDVASAEFGVNGKQANISRVAFVTGISRRELTHLRSSMPERLLNDRGSEPLWSGHLNPASEILHYWYTDPEFSSNLVPNPLSFSDGVISFSTLVKRYAPDLPPTAVKAELMRSGAMVELRDGELMPLRMYHMPLSMDLTFARSTAFSLANLLQTIAHNAELGSEVGDEISRLERYVWTYGVSEDDVKEFKRLASKEATDLLRRLDEWLGEREQKKRRQGFGLDAVDEPTRKPVGCGLGIYYFEKD